MNERKEIAMENSWTIPDTYLSYLDKGFVKVQIRNTSGYDINILKVYCSFQTDNGTEPYIRFVEPKIRVKPRNLSQTITFDFIADLSLREYSNQYELTVEYNSENNKEVRKESFPGKTIIINKMGNRDKFFVVSHKDPEDTELAKKVQFYLERLGFGCFVAESERRPGLDFWNDKIIPRIEKCFGLIVLWTNEASKEPANILKEIELSIKHGRKVILLGERDIDPPDILEQNIEYFPFQSPIIQRDLIGYVQSVYETYAAGGYETSL